MRKKRRNSDRTFSNERFTFYSEDGLKLKVRLIALMFLAISLMIVLPVQPAYSASCAITALQVTFPGLVQAGTVFEIWSSFRVTCDGENIRTVRVQVLDEVTGVVISDATYNRTSQLVRGLANQVKAPNITRQYEWFLTVRVSVINAYAGGTVGWGFSIFVYPHIVTTITYYPPSNRTCPPKDGC